MFGFFCLSKRSKDLFLSAAIVSAVASRLGGVHDFYVKTIPSFAPQYPNINFIDKLPNALSSHRRNVHRDAIFEDNMIFINTWVNQLRGEFLSPQIEDTLLAVAQHCISAVGLRKKVSLQHIVESSRNDTVPLTLHPSREGLVCVTESALAELGSGSLNQIVSSLSRFDFVLQLKQDIKSLNCHTANNCIEFSGYMKSADVIIAAHRHTLLPFFNVLKEKKVFLIADNDMLICDDVKHFSGTQPNLAADLIRTLRTLTHKSL